MQSDLFRLFDLYTLLRGYILHVNISLFIISLLPAHRETDAYIVAQCLLTEGEIRVLLPLLDFPSCCPQEVLKTSYDCTYEFLLQSLPLSKVNPAWDNLVQTQRECLHLAQAQKAMRTEMRGVYNALSGLRQKLSPLGLAIRVHRDGYCLVSLMERS